MHVDDYSAQKRARELLEQQGNDYGTIDQG